MDPGMASMLQRWVDRVVDRIVRDPFRGAWRAVAVASLIATVTGGLLMRVTDPDAFPSIWTGLWWSIQTVTTVGYGDVLPQSAAGRTVAALVMLFGIAFITVTSAAIASAFVEAARRRTGRLQDPQAQELARLRTEVEALAAEVRALRRERPGEVGPPRE
jgi:voltage-gated potassium channel